ncbi:winged helix-turn-helix domain-containing protein [Shewanella chilikensis]|uniref:winged helix-turn-helix domain-containing protein n=1 Tax=Shewanella chilikensis TaxID=558541 RepID=UPI0030050149
MDTTKGRENITVRLNNGNPTISTNTRRYKCSTPELYILKEIYNNKGQAVSRDKLLSTGWNGRVVSPNSIPVAIANLRRVFREISGNELIFTVKGFGYGLDTMQDHIKIEFMLDNQEKPPTEQGQNTESASQSKQSQPSSIKIISIIMASISLFFIPFTIKISVTENLPEVDIYTDGKTKIITLTEMENMDEQKEIKSLIHKLNYKLLGTVDFHDLKSEINDDKDTIILSYGTGVFSIDCINKSHNKISTYVSHNEISIYNKIKDGTACQS